jgi:hypothetical protein
MRIWSLVLLLSLSSLSVADDWSAAREYFVERSGTQLGDTGSGQTIGHEPCTSGDQTSLPLNILQGLGFEDMEITTNPSAQKVTIRANSVVQNCIDMIKLRISSPQIIEGRARPAYFISAAFDNAECAGEGEKCSYRVIKNGVPEEAEYTPNYAGFRECLKDTGVISVNNGAVSLNPDNFDSITYSTQFSLERSGDIYWRSQGPLFDADQSSFGFLPELSNGQSCTYVEHIVDGGRPLSFQTQQDQYLVDLRADATDKCNNNDYLWLMDNLPHFKNLSGELGELKDRILIENVKDVVEKMKNGEEVDTDAISLFEEFFEHIVEPKLNRLGDLWTAIENESDNRRKRELEREYRELRSELMNYKNSLFFSRALQEKLEENGEFEAALVALRINRQIYQHMRLGTTEGSVRITPSRAISLANAAVSTRADQHVEMRRQWEARTGQYLGRADEYANESRYYSRRIETRTENYQDAIDALVQEMQDECTKYWRNQQRCMSEYIEYINALKEDLFEKNESDYELAQDYAERANQYYGLERVGRQRIAAELGDDTDDDDDDDSPSVTVDIARPSFNFTDAPRVQTTQQWTNPYQQNPFTQMQNPYGQQQMSYQYSNPYQSGYQSYSYMSPWGNSGAGAGFQFGAGAGGGYGGFGNSNPFYGQNPYMGYGQQYQQWGNPYGQQWMNPAYSPMRAPAYFGM